MNRKRRISAACLALVASAILINSSHAQSKWTPLFDGKDLAGWDGDPRLWSVHDGVLVGSTDQTPISHNEFLISKEQFGDFVLHAEMKLRNHNSGIQFRSAAYPEYVVKGYQADAGQDNYWGNLYEEGGTRGTMVDGWAAGGKEVAHLGGWNTYDIRCQGDHITITLNGKQTVDIHDSKSLTGVIGLQLHAGTPMEVSFRDIKIQKLD
ncbi:3-keto-disaccharide hydrolase [Nevskia soli]|uniref:3-keto-disaccharide hydrolase n=1 Tax=Nevskia soli TaxID=418856 RepID=UPI0015D6BF90|nr:DUF1080 domain-containing protein [Nevskia soli]